MPIVKKCRHGRGKSPRARRAAWRSCGCQWYGDLRVNGVRVYPKLSADEAEARAEYARLIADREAGKLVVSERVRPTVKGAAKGWYAERAAEKPPPRPATLAAYRSRVKVLGEWYGDVAIERVTPADVEEFWRDVETTYAANYARDIRTTTRHVFEWAVRERLVKVNPCPTNYRRRNGHGARSERLTLADAERVVKALDEPCRSMAEVALLTGLRRGELLGLRCRDFDGSRLRLVEQVTEHGRGPLKTSTSERVVVLSPRAAAILDELTDGRDGAEPVFRIGYWSAGVALRDAMREVGVYTTGRGWHSFRHANAALRERAGESLRSAAAALGHGARYAQTLAYGWSAEHGTAVHLDDARASAHGNAGDGAGSSPRVQTPPEPL